MGLVYTLDCPFIPNSKEYLNSLLFICLCTILLIKLCIPIVSNDMIKIQCNVTATTVTKYIRIYSLHVIVDYRSYMLQGICCNIGQILFIH